MLGNVPGVRCPGISVMEPKDVILGNVPGARSRHLCHPGARCPGISVMEPKDVIQMSRHLCQGTFQESDVQASPDVQADVQASLSWSRKT